MFVLELIGAIFSIAGALFISKATNEWLYKAFIAFFISNLMLLAFFTINGKIPMIIQMVFFFSSAILGIYRLSLNKNRDKYIMLFILTIYSLILGSYLLYNGIKDISFSIEIIDVIAASMAIIGSFLLSSKNLINRNVAYILFLLADVLFVYIGYTNAFYFFMIQSFVYIYTSSLGLYNNNKKLFEEKKLIKI
jgi:hypothetical protein